MTPADTESQKSLTDGANEDAPSLDAAKGTRPVGIKTRTPSHSLLSSSPSTSTFNRKSRFADIGTTGSNIGRASISMPPPATTPSFTYRPSTSRRPSATLLGNEKANNRISMESTRSTKPGNEMVELEDVEKTPNQSTQGAPLDPSVSLSLPEPSLKPPSSDTDGSSNRLSFSLYSLGSAIYNGATGAASAPQSTASSNAGSIKSNPLEQHGSNSAPLSPSKGSLKGEMPSSATTATDPVSVTANAQLQHTGLLSK